MIVNAFITEAIPLSLSCSLFIPKSRTEEIPCLALPEKNLASLHTQNLSNLDDVLSQTSSKSYVVVSHKTAKWQREEIEAILRIMKRGAHIVLDGGALEDYWTGIRKDPVENLRQFEKIFFRPSSLLLSLKSMPWSMAAPFILKLLLQLKEGMSLFLDPGPMSQPSSLIADMAWGLKQHRLKISSRVAFFPVFRQGVVSSKFGFIEIPFFQELEKLQCEMQSFSASGIVFLEKEGVRPLCHFSQGWFLKNAIEQQMSLRSFVRMILRQERPISLQQIGELEEDMCELEKTFLSHSGVIPEKSSFSAILESFVEKVSVTI